MSARGISSPAATLWSWKQYGSTVCKGALVGRKKLLPNCCHSSAVTTSVSNSTNVCPHILQQPSGGQLSPSTPNAHDSRAPSNSANASSGQSEKRRESFKRWVPPGRWTQLTRASSSDNDWNKVDNYRKVACALIPAISLVLLCRFTFLLRWK